MTSDLDLLRQFARDNSQDAFAEIVRQHLDLVYSAALRQVRSPQLAEEIAQSVFADLARNAGTMSGTGVPPADSLTPWLYAVTRRTAIDVIRKESRRQLREQIAVQMNNMNATSADWTQIAPLLDDAMAALDEADRSAVLLRYFENKSLREVGETLGASEDAAQKRVGRAVERLREFFSKRNVTIGASGLAVLISGNAVQSAPIGLAAAISTAAVLAGTIVSSSTVIAATKTIAMTTLQKTLVTVTVAVLAGGGIYEAKQTADARAEVQTLQQQQAPLAEQIRQLQRERDDVTNQLAGLLRENARMKSNSDENELLQLRGKVTRLDGLANENNNLKMKISELEGRWFNVTNSPQFSMPYFPKGRWNINGNGDPLEILLSAATAATDGDNAKLSELASTNSQSLFTKQRWDNVKGIQIVSTDYLTY
ncbi:MAG TPA: sigma-70 family RNA polymerase sigma factor, partial [Verrucomicrobiae bacterium]|nr:sigma-70 family RNA polymerase sigma factor [Verrucomicrobiae bacterium]